MNETVAVAPFAGKEGQWTIFGPVPVSQTLTVDLAIFHVIPTQICTFFVYNEQCNFVRFFEIQIVRILSVIE